jgi:hypothetical protein
LEHSSSCDLDSSLTGSLRGSLYNENMNDDQDINREERGIYLVILGAMIPIVFGTLIAHDVFDAGSTISLLLLVLAVFGLFSRAILRRPRPPLPEARLQSPPH